MNSLAVFDQRDAKSILHAPTRISHFQFGGHATGQPFRQAAELDHGCLPYRGCDIEGTLLSRRILRELALPLGFVDVKVCAVDDVWSGLKLVVRKSLR